ncbi:hypothetical protein [Streptomyces sp. NPDC015130]|uniref:hypothetical protein n=1 Tax=Streptomyces sp. NPDC015130 TaxID=3364940 RepID=UPI003700B26A
MRESDWDDDSGYRAAVRRTRILMGFGLVVAVAVIGAVVVTALGVALVLGWAGILDR